MYPFNKITTLLLAAFMAASIYACVEKGNSQNATAESSAGLAVMDKIPALLDRPENLWYGNEWQTTQNAYGKARQELIKDPNAKEPWLNLAEVFILEARVTGEHPHYYPAALQVLDEMLSKNFDPKDMRDMDLKFRGLSDKASVELSLHEFAKALETGKQAVEINPHNAAVYGVLVDANVELGQYEEAVKMADKMVSIRPDLRSYSRVSYLREIYGDVNGSIEAMDMAVKAGAPGTDQTAWTRLTLGNLYKHYGKDKEAEMQYLIILEERPDYPFALAALGNIETERKNYTKALDYLQKAAAIIPEVSFYEGMAKVYKATGQQDQLQKTVDEIIAMMEDDAAHGHNMDLEFAKVYADLKGDPAKALAYAQKEYDRRPDNIDVNGEMADLYFKMGDNQKATMHLEKALRTGSKKPEWLALK
ncbi:MAG: tetratricopeptide repeat protein [Lewinellaceae bacterium]|nr:tetratricopeptide repeat protein [Saprospiraceae bacterium]MCB9340485.1 tetratricopeptide repeat protein [Lewinellaceae bacterium]